MTRPSIAFVVDDDEPIREALATYLKILGIPSQTFASAEAFLEAFNADWTGCLLLDLRMPGMGGLGLIDELQKRLIALPTVLMTAHSSRDSLPNLQSFTSVFAILLKPFSVEQLKDVIDQKWTNFVNAHESSSRPE